MQAYWIVVIVLAVLLVAAVVVAVVNIVDRRDADSALRTIKNQNRIQERLESEISYTKAMAQLNSASYEIRMRNLAKREEDKALKERGYIKIRRNVNGVACSLTVCQRCGLDVVGLDAHDKHHQQLSDIDVNLELLMIKKEAIDG